MAVKAKTKSQKQVKSSTPILPISISDKTTMDRIDTGIKSLDWILHGGIPTLSVNIVTGPPGSGKTILTQQIIYNNASPENKVLYLTTLSEPAVKLIRYLQQFEFFDLDKLNSSVIYVDIGEAIRTGGLMPAVETVIEHVKSYAPSIVVIDSFKAIHDMAKSAVEVRQFGYDLCVKLSTWECTSFLIGEYTEEEIEKEPIFAIADGIFNLTNDAQAMQRIREVEILKLRGGAFFSGKHPFTISNEGVEVFPRIKTPSVFPRYEVSAERVPTGVLGLDEMFMTGLPKGSATLVAGGAGTGKTLLGLHFITCGVSRGEPGVIVTFQENPSQLYDVAQGFGWDFRQMEKNKLLKVLYSSPVELGVDEHTSKVKQAVNDLNASRVMVDSLMDLEVATPDKVRYKDYIYSLVNFFKSRGVTCFMTNEIAELFGPIRLTSYGVSFIADNVILLRYVEVESAIRRALSVLKMRGSNHDKEVREFKITPKGIQVLAPFKQLSRLLTGVPVTAGSTVFDLVGGE